MRIQRRVLALVVVAFATTLPLFAQATFDAQSNNPFVLTSVANTATLAHTTTTAQNRLLLVAVHMNVIPSIGTTVTSITYGGQPLTLLNAITDASDDTRTEVWYRLNPATGANNVVVTAGGITPGQSIETVVSATTFSDADQAVPGSATNAGANDPATVSIAAANGTDIIVDFISARETVTLTPDAQTQGYNTSSGGTNNDVQASVSGRAAATPTTNMSWNVSANRNWSIVAVNIRQALADVEVTQSALNDPVIPGGTLTYTFRIANNGPAVATAVTLTDTLPGTVTFVSSNTTQGSCSGTSTVTCSIGTLASGATATVTIQVTAPLTGGTIATNTGTVTTSTTDPVTPNTASATAYSLVQALVCGTQPGKDGAGGTLAGVVNAYWPGTANAAAGATTITVGARRGAAVSITPGDLLLIIQMQDAAINSSNDDRYGDGNGITGGTSGIGAGYTNANNSGRYEYAIATNTINAAGGNLTFTAVGGGNGLVYAYTNAAATATMGQRRFQVVRVPQYTTATMGATLTASSWNGTTGGILAFDVAGDLALGSATVNVNGLGFRGGAGLQLAGGGAATATDYRNTGAQNTHGIKGEGIAGTPEDVLDGGVNVDVGPQGYPNGDHARGAPGNAGGGGTDTDPALNQQNSGGGGGANWGRGGTGGNAWQTNLPRGGFGGAPFYNSPGRVVLGGGGGAGARNNSSGIAAAGAAGGGIVLIRAGSLTGTGTVTANGAAAYNDTANDGGGGGGAGGSIVILTRGGGFTGLTVQANGGRGGDAWRTQAPGVFPGERHGPGGGGGGGYIALNGTPAASSVNGGASGITTTANDTFGAQPGAPGNVLLAAQFDEITGVKSGCTDLSVATSDSPDPVTAGNNLTFTQSVTNNSTTVPAYVVKLTQTTPAGTTFVSMTPPAGWSCTTPVVGGTGTIECTKTTALAAGASSGNFVFIVATDPALANGATITQPVSTSTVSPEPNLANNTAQTTTTVQRRVDVAIAKTSDAPGTPQNVSEGDTLTYTLTVTNNGPSRATNVVVTDPLPSGFSFTSVNPAGPTCTQASGTVTCTYATMNPSASNVITITGTVTVNSTELVNTATATRTETDTNATNDSATHSVGVLAPTFVRILDMSAAADAKGRVVVSWTTSFEADNLGFNVYRDAGGAREQLNKHLIAGSAFFSNREALTSGRGYRWKDQRGSTQAQYWIEDVDLRGVRTLHGPVTPLLQNSVPDDANTDTIADLGTNGGIFVSPRGAGAPRYPASTATAQQLAQQWDLASQPAVKLMVTEEGWYRVPKASLAAAGLDVSDMKKLSLFTAGVEQPMAVSDDAVEFYGIAIDTLSSGARPYWIVREKGANSRVKVEKSKKGGAAATSTPYTYQRIERTIFFSALVNNGERENFFGALLSSAPATQTIVAENLDRTAGAASLELVIQGATDGQHLVRVDLNGTSLETLTFASQQRLVRTLAIPSSLVRDGDNTLTLTSLGTGFDISTVESLRFTYPHKLIADDNALKVVAASGASISVGGFTATKVHAFDITDAAQPVELEVSLASGTASLVAPDGGSRTILVVGDTRVLAPAQIVPSRASAWSSTNNSADLVIIAARSLAAAAEPLKARRTSEGVVTQIVDVQDLYDEFGFGVRGPEAIREFLRRTRSWKRAPRYAILLGDASYDPRNYLGTGNGDFVPTRLVPTAYMKTASDDWLADLDGTGVAQIAIGRLPARSLADAQTMIARIVSRAPSGAWANTTSFLADSGFSGDAQSLASLVPAGFTNVTGANFESLLLTYVGHGSLEYWNANGLTGAGASQLANGSQLPVVAAMTCLNGYFQDVTTPSLAEALLSNANGGAVAVWASSALTEPRPQMAMAREFLRQLFAGATLGDAALAAKRATNDPDVRRSWMLFGDPSMKLR
jgi:uncharacterized repeat protein (TIGR01451 family)